MDPNIANAFSPHDTSRELIFIQAGPASNWVGAHFWNLHESTIFQKVENGFFYIPVLFRMNERYPVTALRPRLIAIDTLGSLRSPQMEITPFTPRSATVSWDGDVETIKQDESTHSSVPVEFVFCYFDSFRKC